MKPPMRWLVTGLVATLSNLVRHARTGYESEYRSLTPTRTGELEMASRFAGVSARCCRESWVFFRLSLYYLGRYARSFAIAPHSIVQTGPLGVQKPRAQSERPAESACLGSSSCPPSNHENGGGVK